MNKEELVELLEKSQDAILERVDSKLQELKRSVSEDQEDCVRSVVKKVKEDHSISGRKWETRSTSSLTSWWKPDLIQPSPPLRTRS